MGERVSRIRGEPFDRAPIAVRATEAQQNAAIELQASFWLPEEQARARGRTWADLGLGSSEEPAQLLVAVARDLAGVALAPADGRLLVDPRILPPEDFLSVDEETPAQTLLLATGVRPDEPLLAHYLAHALQKDPVQGAVTTDAWLAHRAAYEGEATLIAIRLLLDPMGLDPGIVDLDPSLVLDGRLTPAGSLSPTELERRMLEFVHADGYLWARKRYATAGWNGLKQAPRTTGAILDPTRDHAGEHDPDTPAGPDGWQLLDRDRLGRWGIFLWISMTTGKDSLALLSIEGWQGGALERFGGDAGELTRWTTDWSDSKSAEQFRYSIERSFGARFPGSEITGQKTEWRTCTAGESFAAWRRLGNRVELWIGPHDVITKAVAGIL